MLAKDLYILTLKLKMDHDKLGNSDRLHEFDETQATRGLIH
jgi:hypothetical protein